MYFFIGCLSINDFHSDVQIFTGQNLLVIYYFVLQNLAYSTYDPVLRRFACYLRFAFRLL